MPASGTETAVFRGISAGNRRFQLYRPTLSLSTGVDRSGFYSADSGVTLVAEFFGLGVARRLHRWPLQGSDHDPRNSTCPPARPHQCGHCRHKNARGFRDRHPVPSLH